MKLALLDARAYSLLWDGQIEKSLEVATEGELLVQQKTDDNSKYWLGRFLSLKGTLLNFMGNLESAIYYQKKALNLRIEISDRNGVADSLGKIALVYKNENNLKEAINYLLRSLEEFEQLQSVLGSARTLLEIVLVFIKINNLKKAKIYRDKLAEMHSKFQVDTIQICYKLATGLILKKETRIVKQAKAFDILKKLSKVKIQEYELEAIVMFNLCELLLDEFKQYGDLEIFNELVVLIDHIYNRAKKENLSPMMIEILILKSNLNLIQGNIKETEIILDQALALSNEKELTSFSIICKEAINKFHENLEEWNDLVTKGSSIRERVNKLNLKKYVDRALELSNQYKH